MTTPSSLSSIAAIVHCNFCQAPFSSRNLFFRHLRDPNVSCGRNNDNDNNKEQEKVVPMPPSMVKKVTRERQRLDTKSRRYRRPTTAIQIQAPKQHRLWIGDLPLPWTRKGRNYQRLRALLRYIVKDKDNDVAVPVIQHVQRKAYRRKNSGTKDHCGEYLGYTIVALRDEEECTTVLERINSSTTVMLITVSNVLGKQETSSNDDFRQFVMEESSKEPFSIRARPYAQKDENEVEPSAAEPLETATTPSQLSYLDPPIRDQLQPLETRTLLAYADFARGTTKSFILQGQAAEDEYISHAAALDIAVDSFHTFGDPRRFIDINKANDGCIIPLDLQSQLLEALTTIRWPVRNHRPRVSAERYMVLHTTNNNDAQQHQHSDYDDDDAGVCNNNKNSYHHLRKACRALMDWGAPSFYYSAIAVTKNFVASPHVDEYDQTIQYAISLGNFDSTVAGQLCVSGFATTTNTNDDATVAIRDDGDTSPTVVEPVVYVVNTHNRLACVDGRHVHWVRQRSAPLSTDEEETRYSLIFYDTTNTNPTPIHPQGVVTLPLHGDKESKEALPIS